MPLTFLPPPFLTFPLPIHPRTKSCSRLQQEGGMPSIPLLLWAFFHLPKNSVPNPFFAFPIKTNHLWFSPILYCGKWQVFLNIFYAPRFLDASPHPFPPPPPPTRKELFFLLFSSFLASFSSPAVNYSPSLPPPLSDAHFASVGDAEGHTHKTHAGGGGGFPKWRMYWEENRNGVHETLFENPWWILLECHFIFIWIVWAYCLLNISIHYARTIHPPFRFEEDFPPSPLLPKFEVTLLLLLLLLPFPPWPWKSPCMDGKRRELGEETPTLKIFGGRNSPNVYESHIFFVCHGSMSYVQKRVIFFHCAICQLNSLSPTQHRWRKLFLGYKPRQRRRQRKKKSQGGGL